MSTNNKAKVITPKKPMSPQAKRNLANIFGSFISNQRAIDGAKEMPIWVAIIFLLLSIFLPVIPTMVSNSNAYGSSFIATYSYGLDVTLPELSYQLKKEGYSFEVVGTKDNMELKGYKDSTALDPYALTPIARYTNKLTGEYNLSIYYSEANFSGDSSDITSLKHLSEVCTSDSYLKGTTTVAPVGTEENIYTPSFVILHKTRLYVYLYSPSTTTAIAASYDGCNWNNFDTSTTNKLLDRVIADANHDEIVYFNEKVFKNWKTVLDESYLQQKGTTFVASPFIYLGIYLGLVIFMGLMIFLLTRGKKNVFRYLSFLTCEKIAAWASLSPAVIGLILGFIFPSQAILFFIMVLGIRIMWLSMKQLRPQQY